MTVLLFIISILLSFLPGIFGTIFSANMRYDAWYSILNKSVLNPPSWVFPIAWNLIYLALGVALFLVLINNINKSKKPLFIFIIHMFANAFWSYLFFELHMVLLSALLIIALLAIAWIMRKEFSKINRAAGILVWPYILWLCFALYLNSAVYFLN